MKNKSSKKIDQENLPDRNQILEIIGRQKKPLRLDTLLKILQVDRRSRRMVEKELQALEIEGQLLRMHGGLWCRTDSLKRIRGRFQPVSTGGLVQPSGNGAEIFIHPRHTGGAWPKDLVEVALVPGSHGAQGKILKIIERPQKEVAAILMKKEGNTLFCRPTDRRLGTDFRVNLESGAELARKLKPGILLSVRPEKPLSEDHWQAELVNIFGAEDRVSTQEVIVKCNHPVPADFPQLCLKEAASLPRAPLPEDYEGREDWRHLPFVTIDGADARDFDDAIHVEQTDDGFILRVAIADVSHYVRPDKREGSLDEEAKKRGNSWYFPRSVEPMLPEALSNGLCSLRPGEDRLAMLVEIPCTASGQVKKPRFAPIVMRSAARLVYEDVAAFFDAQKTGEAPQEAVPTAIRPMLVKAFSLYKKLAEKRHERGTLDFELPEPAYKFDEAGRLLKMFTAERTDANRLIEEFMIAANEAVATHLGKAETPFLYRVHPVPEQAKVDALYESLVSTVPECLPAGLQKEQLTEPKTIQKILGKAAGTPEEYIVNRLCLRSMSQARYAPVNEGHFGLASRDYCHFTSPIRRYADLLVHRALKYSLGLKGYKPEVTGYLWDVGSELNGLEREALECEREMARRMGCLALKQHEGKVFSGTVSGVTGFGLFVEFDELPTEGLLRIEKLGNDWFELNAEKQMLIGEKTGQIYRLGKELLVRVAEVDLDRLEVKLELSEPPAGGPRRIDRRKGTPSKVTRQPGKGKKRPPEARKESQDKKSFRGRRKPSRSGH